MSADMDIQEWLCQQGVSSASSSARLRQVFEEENLTRPGKKRISAEKLPRLSALLSERFFRHCGSRECLQVASESQREPLEVDRSGCERCGGSDNHRAGMAFLESFHDKGFTKLLVVGGSPSVRQELKDLLDQKLSLRMVDGTERRTLKEARPDLDWADLVLIWGASELHHKVSKLYTDAPHPQRRKVVLVARRGVAALLQAGVDHLRNR